MDFDSFLRKAAPAAGINWRKYRRRSSRRRIEARMADLGITSLDEYLAYLRSDPGERETLPDLMRVTISRFFREKERWQTLAEQVIPELLVREGEPAPFRVWSAGCCGGEEAYSLAMTWLEEIAPAGPGRAVEIVATDIDEAALERARKGCYDATSLREVPSHIREKYFIPAKGAWRIASPVRDLVRFEKSNLMTDRLPGRFDLVLCRYLVFTYYEGERLQAATARLRHALRPGGVLMIGKKERLPPQAAAYFAPLPGCEGFHRAVVHGEETA